MIHEISPDHPGVLGAFLTEKQIEEVAKTLYNRFDYTYGLRPSWTDNEKVRKLKTMEVRRVLDALSISGYRVTKMGIDEERLPRK